MYANDVSGKQQQQQKFVWNNTVWLEWLKTKGMLQRPLISMVQAQGQNQWHKEIGSTGMAKCCCFIATKKLPIS